MYLYAWVKYELETREREESLKMEQGKMQIPQDTSYIRAYPCMHKLYDQEKNTVLKRFDNMHQVDIRSNILCPVCKNRIEVILM